MDSKKAKSTPDDNRMNVSHNDETCGLTADLHTMRDYNSAGHFSNDPTSACQGFTHDSGYENKQDAENTEVHDDLFGLNERSSFVEKIQLLSQRSLPVIISFFLSLSGSLINLLFAGRFVPTTGDRSIVFAGVSLGNMFANVTCFSILIGMSSAIETLGSQHNGAGEHNFTLLDCYYLPINLHFPPFPLY